MGNLGSGELNGMGMRGFNLGSDRVRPKRYWSFVAILCILVPPSHHNHQLLVLLAQNNLRLLDVATAGREKSIAAPSTSTRVLSVLFGCTCGGSSAEAISRVEEGIGGGTGFSAP